MPPSPTHSPDDQPDMSFVADFVIVTGPTGQQVATRDPASYTRRPGWAVTSESVPVYWPDFSEQESLTMNLNWTTAASADKDNHDQEVDLSPLGNPGGAQWAMVAPEGTHWIYRIYTRWLWKDIDADPDATTPLAGETSTEDEAKAAVQAWVDDVTSPGPPDGNNPVTSIAYND